MGVMPQLRFPEFNGKWAERQLDEIVDKKISYGIVQAGPNIPSGMPYIKSKDLNTPLIINELERTSNEIAKRYRRSEVSPGDIVFSLRGNIGVSQIVPAAISVANLTQGTARISVEKLAVNTFVFRVLETQNIRKRIFAVMKGSTFQEISLGDLRQIKICMPPVSEQKKIAEFLGAVDEKIRLLKSRHEQLTLYKKGVMQKIFAQTLRFKADDGSDFPDWEMSTLGKYFVERSERDDAKAELLSVTMKNGVVKRSALDGKNNASSDRSNYKQVKIGDIAYNSMRMWQGANGVSPYDGIISPAYTVVTPKPNAEVDFFGYLFKYSEMIFLFQRNSQGLTSDTWNLKYPAFSLIKFMIPTSKKEQQKIANFLSAIDDKIEAVAAQIEKMQSFKKGLLQQMFV